MTLSVRITRIAAAAVGGVAAVVSIAGAVGAYFNPIQVTPANAQPPAGTVSEQLVATYKSVCYDVLPDVDAIERHASASGWTPITGMSLRMLAPEGGAKLVKGWNAPAKNGRVAMTIAVSISDMDAEMAATLPDFAKSDLYGCSVTAGAPADHEQIASAIVSLIGRAHDEVTEAGSLFGHVWAGSSEDSTAIVTHYRPKRVEGFGINMLSLLVATR